MDITARYQALLFRRAGGDPKAMATEDAKFSERAKRRKWQTPPIAGTRIEFANDRFTDKGPATGVVSGWKTTVDGNYITVQFGDEQQMFSWDDLIPHISDDRRDGVILIKAMPTVSHGHGHVFPRADGIKMRCGGPANCKACQQDVQKKKDLGRIPDDMSMRQVKWAGLTLRIENEAGSVRSGKKPDGGEWHTRMKHAYGEILHTEGVDGDHVDVFIGPNMDGAKNVYIVHQKTVDNWQKYDEDKCMLGFDSIDDAKQAFLANYDDPRFLGPITIMPVDKFVEKARATAEKPAMIKALVFLRPRS